MRSINVLAPFKNFFTYELVKEYLPNPKTLALRALISGVAVYAIGSATYFLKENSDELWFRFQHDKPRSPIDFIRSLDDNILNEFSGMGWFFVQRLGLRIVLGRTLMLPVSLMLNYFSEVSAEGMIRGWSYNLVGYFSGGTNGLITSTCLSFLWGGYAAHVNNVTSSSQPSLDGFDWDKFDETWIRHAGIHQLVFEYFNDNSSELKDSIPSFANIPFETPSIPAELEFLVEPMKKGIATSVATGTRYIVQVRNQLGNVPRLINFKKWGSLAGLKLKHGFISEVIYQSAEKIFPKVRDYIKPVTGFHVTEAITGIALIALGLKKGIRTKQGASAVVFGCGALGHVAYSIL